MLIQIGELHLNVSPHVLAGVVAGSGALLMLLIICCCCWCWCCCCRKNRKDKKNAQNQKVHVEKRSAQKIHVEDHPEVKGDQKGGSTQHPLHQNDPKGTAEHRVGPNSSPAPHSQSPYTSRSIEDSMSSTKNRSSVSPHSAASFASSQTIFNYDELAIATNGFFKANILGQGGFGFVHKGVLPTGKEIAVKSMKADSGQGEREFQAEVDIISRVHHKHLVSLVGYCMTGSQRLLVYEFVPNKTLEYHLHGKGRPALDWSIRMRIAIGAAKGLAYLHEDCHPKIIHRDIKTANILIDDNFEAKVADFGLAKVSSLADTHVSTRVMGTLGYLAPEYASSGKVTAKSDVYSFGVMLLELITGRRPFDRTQKAITLVEWARPLLTSAVEDQTKPLLSNTVEDNNFSNLVDPRIKDCYRQTEMSRMVFCAATCVRKSARHRPQMSQVIRALEGNMTLTDLSAGVTPGRSMMKRYDSTSEYSGSQYNGTSKGYGTSSASDYSSISTREQYTQASTSSSEGQTTR